MRAVEHTRRRRGFQLWGYGRRLHIYGFCSRADLQLRVHDAVVVYVENNIFSYQLLETGSFHSDLVMADRQGCSDVAAVCAGLDFAENSVAIRIGDLYGSAADSCSGRVLHNSADVSRDFLCHKETSSRCNDHNEIKHDSTIHKSSWLPKMLPETFSRHLLLANRT